MNEFIGVEEDTEEGLVRASNVDSYDEIANPGFIQSAVVVEAEESSKNEWSLKFQKLKRNTTYASLASNAKIDSLGNSQYSIKPISISSLAQE